MWILMPLIGVALMGATAYYAIADGKPAHKSKFRAAAMAQTKPLRADGPGTSASLTVPFDVLFNDVFYESGDIDDYAVENVNSNVEWTFRNSEEGVSPGLYLYYDEENAADNWVFTPAVHLDGGKYYAFTAYLSSGDPDYGTELAALAFGEAQAADAMTIVGPDFDIAIHRYEMYDQMIPRTIVVNPQTDGDYHLGIHGISEPDNYFLACRGIAMTAPLDPQSPVPVQVFDAYRSEETENTAVITATLPSTTVAGDALAEITKAELLRDGVKVHEWPAPRPGSEISFDDTPGVGGEYTYSIVVTANGVASAPVNLPVTVSNPAIGLPENIKLRAGDDGKVTIAWDAPAKDRDEEELGEYNGIRYRVLVTANDGSEPQLVGDTDATSIQWVNPDMDTHMFYQFSVRAYITAGATEYVSARAPFGKPYELPLNITFNETDDELSSMVNSEVSEDWVMGWITTSSQAGITSGADGGGDKFACFSPGSKDYTAVLHTPLVNLDADNPILEFDWAGVGNDAVNNLTVNAIVASGEVTVLKEIELKADLNTWHHETVDLGAFAGQTVRVDFVATTGNYYRPHVAIDNISYRNLAPVSVAAKSIAAPQVIVDNKPLDFVVHVKNLGSQTVGNYTVNLYRDGEIVATTSETPEVGMLQELPVVISDRLNMTQSGSHLYKAEVEMEGDADESDNMTSEIEVILAPSELPVVELASTHDNDGNTVLTWSEPDLSNVKPDPVVEDFENEAYPAFAIDAFGGWTVQNYNESDTYGISPYAFENSGASYGWILVNGAKMSPELTDQKMLPRSGSCYAGAMAHRSGANDAWLVSPELTGDPQTVSFFASATIDPEEMELYYSTSGTEKADFQQLAIDGATKISVPKAWTEYSIAIPDGAKYFAIRSVSKNNYMLKVDDVSYIPAGAVSDIAVAGYNIYRDGVRIATVATPAYTDVDAPEGIHTYMVTVAYNKGESMPSNTVASQGSGIMEIAMPDNASAEYYDLQGRRVTHPVKGIYIEVKDGKARKLICE